MSFPRYPKYKDSGVEWLGEVPEHWELRPLKYVVSLRSGGTPNKANLDYWDGDVPWASSKDLKSDNLDDTGDHITQRALDDGAAELVPAGSLLIVVRGMILIHTFPVVKALVPVAINQDLKALTPCPNLDKDFLGWLLRGASAETLGRIDEAGHGTKVLRLEAWTSMILPLPPASEQAIVRDFLDRETRKIDELVAEQQRLMGLLKEKRQAVISHAVTKGLNPHAPMKPSGIEWLGDVPSHWKIGKCGFYMSILSGFAFPSVGFTDDERETKLLRGINVGISCLKWADTVYWKRTPDDGLEQYELRQGDVVIGMDRPLIGDGMRVAKVTASDLPCLLLQRVASLKSGSGLHADYLLHLLSSEMFVAHFSPETTGVSVPHISPEQIQNFVIPIPPIDEQEALISFIQKETDRIERLTAEAQKAIDLLQERRTALISAAVTGQIDVREVAAS